MNTYEEIGQIPDWYKYYPKDFHYFYFPVNINASAHKIIEVYDTFCAARAGLMFLECDDFGSLVEKDNELSKLYFRSFLFHSSLFNYNICIDLSWQVIWLYLAEPSLDLLYKNNCYKNYLKKCDSEALLYKLTLAKEYGIKDYIDGFFNDPFIQKIRGRYNYYKHRGSFYIQGLGLNNEHLDFSVAITPGPAFKLRKFTRDEIDIDTGIKKMIRFHNMFYKYFENIIKFVIPSNYLNYQTNLNDRFNYIMGIYKYLGENNGNK